MEARVDCKKLEESILGRASWEVLGWGMLDDSSLHEFSPWARSECGKGVLPFEEEIQGGHEKLWAVARETYF